MADRRRLLLLGGTTEASALARRLAADRPDLAVITSLAGRTASPAPLAGSVRTGGFGGIDGLTRYLRSERVDALVDATHPFAAQMPFHASAAGAAASVPRLRLLRPPWMPGPGDQWVAVADLEAAAAVVRALGVGRVFLTTGRQELAPFAAVAGVWFLVRSIDAPDPTTLPPGEVVLSRGPFAEADERRLMVDRAIEAVVTKNSGGAATAAKLAAARALGLPVVMVERPPAPPGPTVATVAEAMAWLAAVLRAS